MLMLGASAKDPEEGVTGKFGLGFKSLLLASRAPRVWSGDLSFDVVAGCLPRKWVSSEETRQFRQNVSGVAQKGLRATLFELSLDERELVGQVVERFSGLAGLLPVFARRVVQVDVDGESHQWRPVHLSLLRGYSIEVGSVAIPVGRGKVRSGLMAIRVDSGCVVLRTGISGIELFDREAFVAVPAVWVTAPTRGTPARGFLINASFQIDTGRATLAQGQSATTSNSSLVETIANEVAPVFVDLLAASQNTWGELASQIGFAGSLQTAAFWLGLWTAILGESPAEEAAHDVRLMDRFGCTLFRHVVNLTGLIPNGFTEERAGFVEVSKISLSLQSHYLSAVVPALRSWPLFIEQYPIENWCTGTVRRWLGRAKVEGCPEITELGIAEVVACFGAKRLAAEEVSALACVLRLWPSNLGEHDQWRKALSDIHLQSQSGSWVSASAIIGRSPLEDDYLVQFAPDSIILNRNYTALGDDFEFLDGFLQHRGLDPSSLASWCLAAESDAQQLAVVHWLSRNPYSQAIDWLRSRKPRGGWLFELTQESASLLGLSTEERLWLLSRLGLRRDEVIVNELDLYSGLSLELIHGWWSERSINWIQKFDERLWPSLDVKEALKAEPFDRNAWMTLFSLGVFRRYGRVNDEQHRGFLDFLHSRGWWQTICEVDPDLGADAWLGILREYAEQRQTDTVFELWMDSFPRLYRVARWLDTYVHLFQSLDQRESEFAKFLLSPAADTSLSGSGIDAPTLSGILRLGQHLVIRELLRVQVLSSPVAKEKAFAPRSAVLELMNQLGFEGLQSSSEIFKVLVDELGDEEKACFNGAYDIPLQLIATDASARREAERWAEGRLDDTDYDGELET
jgi:hypothetical protein